ncbi:lysyl oxidase family protein [Mucisphaera sp.]|uniref:lysyl oxidase family protein n=1 Tax=Mucisphaera sp. TaxID=2913024 RepID=UPI003D0B0D68
MARWRLLITCLGLVASLSVSAGAGPLLPDLTAVSDRSLGYMYDGEFDLEVIPGRVIYRFSAAIPNLGDGPFEVSEVTDGDLNQTVYQRIHQEDGSIESRVLGVFPDADPPFGHLFLVGLAEYNLREAIPGGDNGGVGDVVATNLKTSHALVDSAPWNLSLPGAPTKRRYNSVDAQVLGVSVGWLDLYHKSIPTQWIDVTGLATGTYWLEVVVDPSNYVEETDETNNTHRVLVYLDMSTVPEPGTAGLLGLTLLSVLTRCRRTHS